MASKGRQDKPASAYLAQAGQRREAEHGERKGGCEPMAGRLADKVALITGGARGIGGASARLFAAEGAKVVIGDLLEVEGAQTVAEIEAAGGAALFVRTDVTQEADCRQLATAAVERFGRLDVVLTCAGILQGAYQAIEDLD